MNILVTGVSGFIGRHVTEALLQQGHAVIALTRSVINQSPPRENFRIVIGDLATGAGFEDICWVELDAVIHLAASGVKASHRIWPDSLAVNVVGTQRLLDAIKREASRNPTVFIARTFYEHLIKQAPTLLDNPYIATKFASSELARLWAAEYPGPVVLGTFFQVYGPGDGAGNVLTYAARELKNRRVAVFGSGKGQRDWIYITDAAAAVVMATQTAQSGLHEVDIGSGSLVSIKDMIEQIAALVGGEDAKVVFDPSKDRPDVDITLAAQHRVPGWQQSVQIQQGLLNLLNTV